MHRVLDYSQRGPPKPGVVRSATGVISLVLACGALGVVTSHCLEKPVFRATGQLFIRQPGTPTGRLPIAAPARALRPAIASAALRTASRAFPRAPFPASTSVALSHVDFFVNNSDRYLQILYVDPNVTVAIAVCDGFLQAYSNALKAAPGGSQLSIVCMEPSWVRVASFTIRDVVLGAACGSGGLMLCLGWMWRRKPNSGT
jgi:hypothetical protein